MADHPNLQDLTNALVREGHLQSRTISTASYYSTRDVVNAFIRKELPHKESSRSGG